MNSVAANAEVRLQDDLQDFWESVRQINQRPNLQRQAVEYQSVTLDSYHAMAR